jgi:EpsI family protein
LNKALWLLPPAFLLVQAAGIHLFVGVERPPAPPDMAAFPQRIGGWASLGDETLPPPVLAALKADRVLSRTYLRQSTGEAASLFVAWFQSQRAGDRQPHSPKVCLPGSGWRPESTGVMRIETAREAIVVNRYVVVNGEARDAILYWYQTPRRVVAGEWEAKYWLVLDALRDQRTDTALVRVVAPVSADTTSAVRTAEAFVKDAYPLLREVLPR